VVARSHETAAREHDAATRPHDTASRLSDVVGRPHKTPARPHEAAPRPQESAARLTDAAARLRAVEGGGQGADDEVSRDHPKPAKAVRWCAIVLRRADRGGEFQVVALVDSGEWKVVCRSETIKLSRSGEARHRGPARQAHDALTRQLLAAGWTAVGARGRWHDSTFVRSPGSERARTRRAVIRLTPQGDKGSFQAEELDEFGSATPIERSAEFSLPAGAAAVDGDEARAAHQALIARLARAGWAKSDSPGAEWYSVTMVSGQSAETAAGSVTAMATRSKSQGLMLLDDLLGDLHDP
jgi:hypothetical protein